MKEFLNALEESTFTYNNEFGTNDCVVCLENFLEGHAIKRIPTCRHFFHPHCCAKWFESKIDEDEQRCP